MYKGLNYLFYQNETKKAKKLTHGTNADDDQSLKVLFTKNSPDQNLLPCPSRV